MKKYVVSIRMICVILCLLMLFTACIDRASYETHEKTDVLNGTMDATDRKIALLEENYGAVQQELATLKTNYDDSKQEIDKLKNNLDAEMQEMESLRESNASTSSALKSLQKDFITAKQEIESLKNQNQTMQQEIEQLKEQILDLQNRIDLNTPHEKIKIYIDQGHNPSPYHNTGAVGNGLYEQDLTFSIGCLLEELLEADGRFEVCLSRPTADTVLGTDNDSSLDARVQGARDFGANYFISLHTNFFEQDTAHGIEVYVAEQGSTSYTFGECLLQGLVDSTGLGNRGMKENASLRVLKNATMPAVLLEMGFISNSGDAKLLSESPALFAQGIYNGILEYFELTSNNTSDY